MSRLTKEQLENYKNTYYKYDGINGYEFDEICDELINYKDLEDELDCPLDVVANKKAMIVKDSELYEVDIMAVSFTNGNIYFGNEWSFTTRKLKDYKKTWWLSSNMEE